MFDKEPSGIVSVRFNNAQSALACVDLINRRNIYKKIVEATIATGEEQFKKSRKQDRQKEGDDMDDEERFRKFGQELEKGGLSKS